MTDAIEQEYSPAKEYLELMTRQGIAAVDTETGDIINAFDPDVSVYNKAEPVAFLLDTLTMQEEAYKKREVCLREKRERVVLLKERIREAFKDQMLKEGVDKVKTLETSFYFMRKSKLIYHIEDIKEEFCEVEIKGRMDGVTAQKFIIENPSIKAELIKKKPLEEYIPYLQEQGIVRQTTDTILCKR